MGEPSAARRWFARGLLLAGLWLTGSNLWSLLRALPAPWDDLLVHVPGIAAGLFFLAAAWRLRSALRWDPPSE